MARYLACVAAVALVGASATAWADGPRGVRVQSSTLAQRGHGGLLVHEKVRFGRNYHLTHGVRFSHGFFFRGREFRHFQYRYWSARQRSWLFYYPGTRCFYYWSAANVCFYPMSYAGTVAPNGVLPAAIDALPDQALPEQAPPVE